MPVTRTIKRLVTCDLVGLAAADPTRLVDYAENAYQARLTRVMGAIRASGCGIVMLTGPSGAGKTTSARKLAGALMRGGVRSQVLSLDDFFVGEGRYPKTPDGRDDYERLESLDLPLLCACLKSLAETGVCDAPIFDFLTQRPSPKTQHIDCHGGVVIVEGLHAFNPALGAVLPEGTALHVYASLQEEYADADGHRVVATRDIRLARRLVRDARFRGHGADFTLRVWPHVCQAEERYIKAFKQRSDLLLDTSFSYEGCLWGQFVREMTAEEYPEKLGALCGSLAGFPTLAPSLVPQNSMLREFLGQDDEINS